MKQIPTPQLIRIIDPALGPIASLAPKTIDLLASEAFVPRPRRRIDPPNHSHETIWEEFLRLQLKPRTRQEYGKSIDYFCRSMAPDQSPTTFVKEFLDSTKQQAIHLVLAWRQRLLDEGKASATINLRISALKSLVEYAGKQDACSFSLSEIKSLKTQRYKDSPAVSVDDYRLILELVDRSTDLGIRDFAILRLLWDLALRREEVVSLDIWDYVPGRLMVKGKGEFVRQLIVLGAGCEAIDLNPQSEDALDHWVAIREGLYFQPKDGGNRDDALFLSCNGRRLSGTDVFRILQGYAEVAGVNVSPHRVRQSAIMIDLGASGDDVRSPLAHAELSAQSLSKHGNLLDSPKPEQVFTYQLKIFIQDIHPLIWRRIRVSSNSTIADLHYIVQIAMGWTDSHLHRFIIDGAGYGIAQIGGISFTDDPHKVRLADFSLRENHRFYYDYDFGDYWQHEILVEKILTSKSNNLEPLCIAGNRACPPEDCGGAERFMAMVQKQKHLTGRAKKWFEEFDKDLVNSRLKLYAAGDPESMLFALILG